MFRKFVFLDVCDPSSQLFPLIFILNKYYGTEMFVVDAHLVI